MALITASLITVSIFLNLLGLTVPSLCSAVGTSPRIWTAIHGSDTTSLQQARRGADRRVNRRRDAGDNDPVQTQSWRNGTNFDASWTQATLLQLGDSSSLSADGRTEASLDSSIKVVCTTCYLKGTATGELSIPRNYSVAGLAHTISNVGEQFRQNLENLTNTAEEYIQDAVDDGMDDLLHDRDLEFPTFDYDFNIQLPPVDGTRLKFTFDRLELYMLLQTTLSLQSTYTISLYRSETPLGISIDENTQLGLTFTIDLILDAQTEVDVSNGFHMKFNDGLAVEIVLFGDNASHITSNGGQFEFLPVSVQTSGLVFTAALRVGAQVGLSVSTPSVLGVDGLSVGAGVEAGVYANVAEFVTNVTAQSDNQACALGVNQAYQFALGAAAGATVTYGMHTWGPNPTTTVPIFYTNLTSACATQSSSVSSAAAPTITSTMSNEERRDLLKTTTLTSTITHMGVNCLSAGLINCPASLQNTSTSTAISTLVTVVPSGTDEDDITWPATRKDTVATTIPFGTGAGSLPASIGSPKSYVPPPSPPATSAASMAAGSQHHGVSKSLRLGLGLGLGLGIPFLIALGFVLFMLLKHRMKYEPVSKHSAMDMKTEHSAKDNGETRSLNAMDY